MKRQWLITLLLLVGALNLYLLVQVEMRDDRKTAAAGNLTTLDPEQITRIEVRRAEDSLLFTRSGQDWQMASPLSGKANAERITELRALAIITPLAQYDVKNIDLHRYGLAQPQVSVRLNNTEIAFGSVNPANGRRYVLTGQRLYLIADNIYPILQLPAPQFLQ